MSLSTYYLEYGRHLARLLRRRRRGCAYAPTSNTASHDSHKKIHGWVSLDFHIREAYGAPLGGSSGRRSSAITMSYFFPSEINNFVFFPLTRWSEMGVFSPTRFTETCRLFQMRRNLA